MNLFFDKKKSQEHFFVQKFFIDLNVAFLFKKKKYLFIYFVFIYFLHFFKGFQAECQQ